MNPIDIFSIISSIGTAIATLLILFTFFEMINQRRTTYRPEIIIKNCTKDESDKRPETWSFGKPNEKLIEFSGITWVKLYNIGLGTVKNVKILWEYNVNGLISYIKHHDSEGKHKIGKFGNRKSIVKNDSGIKTGTIITLSDEQTEMNSDNEIPTSDEQEKFISEVSILLDSELLTSVNHILPISINNSPVFIKTPTPYFDLMEIAIQLTSAKKFYSKKNVDLYRLNMKIIYKDIGNKSITKNYKMGPKFIFIGEKPNLIIGRFLFDEKNDGTFFDFT